MINFCVEPKKPCRKNPIGELDFKIDKCYSSIYSRLCCHENDSVSHISQEERDEWNGKASNSALLDLQNQLNEIAGDGDNSIKKEILIEVSRQIAGAITDLNIEEYAKKKYVDDAIGNIDFDQYVTKENADSTYLNKADYIKFDPTNYYTIAQIQKIIEDSTIGKDYPIQSFTLEHNELILTQKNGGQFRVALSESGSDGGVNTDYVQRQLLNYIKKNTLSKLIINDKVYSIESGRDIKIPISGAGSSIDYTKFGYNKSYFKKHQSNSVAPNKPSANRPPEDGSGWVDDAPNYEAGYYIWMTQVFINGNGQYGEYTNPICLTGTAGENAVSYDIKTSTSTINYQDGTMYPNLISVYVVKSNGSQITNITPSNGSGWSFSYSVDGGDIWTTISSDQIQTEGNNGMLFKATNGTIMLNEYVPIVRSGINGLNGVTYSLQLSNISLSYVPADQNYNLQMSCNVNLYKNESTVDSTDANLYNLYMQINSNDRTSLQYNTDHWDASVNTTVQSKSSTITIYAYNTNGAYLTSMTIPVSSSGDASIGQTFKGSPLRIVGEWQSGKKYYDGKRDAQDGIFYQDVVLYENMYYVCVNTDSGESDHWETTPDVATYWDKFTVTEKFVADKIIANQGIVKELSSEEVVIIDGDSIVAGMTSSKNPDSKSDLNGKVTNKGDVRIWAGEIKNADLTTAPFTVTSTGELKSTKANITGKISATSGNIGGFRLNDNDLVCNKAKFTMDGSNSTDSRKVVLDTKGYKLGSYNFPLFVESYGQAAPLVDDFAGIYINVGGSNDTIFPATYPGILMKRGCFVGFRVPTISISEDMDLNNNNNYMSGMYLFCQNEGRDITITLPTKTTGAEYGDVFTIVKSGGGDVTIKAPTGYVLNSRQYGTRDFVMSNDYQHIHLVLDGNKWYIESSN